MLRQLLIFFHRETINDIYYRGCVCVREKRRYLRSVSGSRVWLSIKRRNIFPRPREYLTLRQSISVFFFFQLASLCKRNVGLIVHSQTVYVRLVRYELKIFNGRECCVKNYAEFARPLGKRRENKKKTHEIAIAKLIMNHSWMNSLSRFDERNLSRDIFGSAADLLFLLAGLAAWPE